MYPKMRPKRRSRSSSPRTPDPSDVFSSTAARIAIVDTSSSDSARKVSPSASANPCRALSREELSPEVRRFTA
jgi:hypothetical protein